MSDELSSPLEPTDEAMPDAELEEEEATELGAEDDVLDSEAEQVEEDDDA